MYTTVDRRFGNLSNQVLLDNLPNQNNHHQITEILLKLDKHYKSTWNETQIMFLFKYSELENSFHENLIVSHWPVFCENVDHDLRKPNIFWRDITT